jgi:hypothetical protein
MSKEQILVNITELYCSLASVEEQKKTDAAVHNERIKELKADLKEYVDQYKMYEDQGVNSA